jgi:catalase
LRRGTHAKGRCVSGTFEVFDTAKTTSDPVLAARLAQGMFAQPGVYRATVRFANGNSQIQRDKMRDARACSFAVELPGGGRQDFAMNNATTFPINDAHAFAVALQITTRQASSRDSGP